MLGGRASRSVKAAKEEANEADFLPGWSARDLMDLSAVCEDERQRLAPAAGSFESWPKSAKHIQRARSVLGSGHFIVFALPLLVAFAWRRKDFLSSKRVEAVLRDNLFGLELDLRCTQIAAFNLALAAWRMVGYRKLPQLNVACTGLGINAREEDWVRIAGNEERLRGAMSALYGLFQQAQVLGSLIDPKRIGGSLFVAEFERVQRLVESALASEQSDEAAHELAVTAQGLVKAVRILADSFTLVATNVPYLGQRKQGPVLEDYCERFHPRAKADLATCFIERCLALCKGRSHCARDTAELAISFLIQEPAPIAS